MKKPEDTFGGLYRGKDNEKLWKEVKEYIEKQYETEAVEKIYCLYNGVKTLALRRNL